jgi:hypothetical protein
MNHMVRDAMKARPEMFAGQKIEFDGGEFRGLSPIELARMSLQRNNVDTRGWNTMKMVGEAFVHRGGSVQTAGDFPILLENVLNKVLLGAYALQSNTWEKFTTSVDVADFRTQKRYRTGSLGALDVIGEHGEYRNGIVPDGSSYGILTKRMGKIFGLSQETIINDDMGALVDQAKQLGQSAMRSIEIAVYALLTANGGLGATFGSAPFFDDATRKNINTTGSALSVFGIDADRVVMQNQKDPNNQDFIDLQPAVLLVPNTLKGTALEVNENQFDFDASGTVSGNSTGKFMRTNRVRGLFKEVVATPRLTGTRRYLFADTMDAIVVAWLQGFGRGPVLESQSGWRVSGVEWKVTVYANPQFGDPKAAVTNAGA